MNGQQNVKKNAESIYLLFLISCLSYSVPLPVSRIVQRQTRRLLVNNELEKTRKEPIVVEF